MSETITAIEEQHDRGDYTEDKQDGFQITTTKQAIWLGIDNFQSCCEDWGYLLSEDDPQKFIGAELRGLRLTDTNRTSKQIVTPIDWEKDGDYDRYNAEEAEADEDALCLDEGGVMFVDIETDRGVLQFVAYNGHNGYYGHEVKVESRQLKKSVVF